MHIISWNINSIRMRLPLLIKMIKQKKPDIICLQETKVPDHLFPEKAFQEMGYPHIIYRGEKGYNGVAIISKLPLTKVEKRIMAEQEDARHIAATLSNGIRIHNFYVPSGGEEPDLLNNPKFKHKLAFVDDMTKWLTSSAKDIPSIISGDFNIAPLEQDVWSHKQLLGAISHTPIEVEKLTKLQEGLGWIDGARHFIPHDEKSYSWWSYRNREWEKSNRGRRLDHIWVNPVLESSLERYEVMTEARSWDRPSDHVPISLYLTV